MSKLKDTRFFLAKDVDSYVSLETPDSENYSHGYTLKIADCHRSASWYFSAHTAKEKRASARKLKKFKELIDALYEELTSSD